MRDMNFFSDMSLEQKRAKSRLAVIVLSLLGVAVLLIGLFLGASLFLSTQENDLARRRDHLNSPQVAAQLEELEQIQQEIASLGGSEQALQALSNYLSYSPRLKTAVLDALVSTMPDDVVISSISVSQGSISLSATSKQERSPLVFSAALKENPYFTDVYLSGITVNSQSETDTTTESVETQPEATEPEATDPGDTEPETTETADTETEETTVETDPDTPTDTEQPAGASGGYSFSISCSIQPQTAEEGDAQ